MSQAQRKWLCCRSRGENFGLDMRWIRQIDFNPRVLPLPTAEPPLMGLMPWRREQVPAISLDLLLGYGRPEGYGAALMLEVDGHRFGLLVEEVGETLTLFEGSTFRLEREAAGREGLVTEAARIEEDLIFGLNAERIPKAEATTLGDGKQIISVNSP